MSKVLGQKYASKIAGRYNSALSNANVVAFNNSSLRFETQSKISRRTGWDLILRRNEWFQNHAVDWLENYLKPDHTVFSYSYAAKEIFEVAKKFGCRTVLGQIDPGIGEENTVAAEVARFPDLDTGFERAPKEYWEDWMIECELADVIMVNSNWSRDMLVKEGIPAGKIEIIPLVYQPECKPSELQECERVYPSEFSADRPLELLYLGQVIPRKGIQYVVSAAEELASLPVKFTVVGNPGPWQAKLEECKNIEVVGSVPRNEVQDYYQKADLFLFPTLSDGFGLTQLEAQHWKLPLICSKNCGSVVEHEVNGLILDEVNTRNVVAAVKRFLQNPELLQTFGKASCSSQFSISDLANRLDSFVPSL